MKKWSPKRRSPYSLLLERPGGARLAGLSKVYIDSTSADLGLVHGLESLGGVSLGLELDKAKSPDKKRKMSVEDSRHCSSLDIDWMCLDVSTASERRRKYRQGGKACTDASGK
jgi:hypothetical protein